MICYHFLFKQKIHINWLYTCTYIRNDLLYCIIDIPHTVITNMYVEHYFIPVKSHFYCKNAKDVEYIE